MMQNFFPIILAASIILFQFGFFAALPTAISSICIPIALLPALIHGNFGGSSVGWSVVLGSIWDAMSPYPFGSYAISFFLSTIVCEWFFRTTITNTSFTSYIALSCIAVFSFYFFFMSALVISGYATTGAAIDAALSQAFGSIGATMIASFVIYLLGSIVLRRFMPTRI